MDITNAGEQAGAGSNTTQEQAGAAAVTVDNSATTTNDQTAAAAAGQQAAPPVEPPAAPQVPEGYVAQAEVETERTARTAAETARQEAETRAQAAEARARQNEIKLHAQALGFNDVSDAERFIDPAATDIESALAAVLESKPYLKKQEAAPVTPTSPTNAARTNTQAPVFTQAQIADRHFWAANKDAIMQAMREGRIQG